MIKKIFIFSLFVAIVANSSLAFANQINNETKSTPNVSNVEEWLDTYFESTDRSILNYSGEDVTFRYENKLKELYKNNEINNIKDYIDQNKLVLSWGKNESIPYGSSVAKNSEKLFVAIETSINYPSIRKEWAVKLKGTFYYDKNSKKITSVNNPVLSIFTTVNFGNTFRPYLQRVSTSYTKNNDYSVTFRGEYTMFAEFLYKVYAPVVFPRVNIHYTDKVPGDM